MTNKFTFTGEFTKPKEIVGVRILNYEDSLKDILIFSEKEVKLVEVSVGDSSEAKLK